MKAKELSFSKSKLIPIISDSSPLATEFTKILASFFKNVLLLKRTGTNIDFYLELDDMLMERIEKYPSKISTIIRPIINKKAYILYNIPDVTYALKYTAMTSKNNSICIPSLFVNNGLIDKNIKLADINIREKEIIYNIYTGVIRLSCDQNEIKFLKDIQLIKLLQKLFLELFHKTVKLPSNLSTVQLNIINAIIVMYFYSYYFQKTPSIALEEYLAEQLLDDEVKKTVIHMVDDLYYEFKTISKNKDGGIKDLFKILAMKKIPLEMDAYKKVIMLISVDGIKVLSTDILHFIVYIILSNNSVFPFKKINLSEALIEGLESKLIPYINEANYGFEN